MENKKFSVVYYFTQGLSRVFCPEFQGKKLRINTSVQGVSSKTYLHLKDNDKEDKKNKNVQKMQNQV